MSMKINAEIPEAFEKHNIQDMLTNWTRGYMAGDWDGYQNPSSRHWVKDSPPFTSLKVEEKLV